MTLPEDLSDSERFIALLARAEQQLSLYVHTLVPHAQDADDILQQGKLVMWRSFSSFQPGTNFPAWARKVLFHQILSYRKRKKRDRLVLSEELLALAHDSLEEFQLLDEYDQYLLDDCLGRISAEHREILKLRYHDELEIDSIATTVGRTSEAVYRLLSRIRTRLAECIAHARRRDNLHEAFP